MRFAMDVDTVSGKLQATGPTTVLAYAPVSIPAGTVVARIDTATRQGQATNPVSVVARSASISGAYRMRFGNRFLITRTYDTVTTARTTTVIRQSIYARAANSASDATFITNFVAAADTFVSTHDFTYSNGFSLSALRATPRFTSGTVQTFIDTVAADGYVIAKANGAS